MAFDNPNQGSETNVGAFPPVAPSPGRKPQRKAASLPHKIPVQRRADKTVEPCTLEGDQWRTSPPQAQSGNGGETGESAGLP
jgi:hypothetical protein